MPKLLIVDGYNILNAWCDALDVGCFERARFQLLSILCSCSSYWGYELIVVFDAGNVVGGREHEETLGPEARVIFSAEGMSADSVIERIVADQQQAGFGEVIIATSDGAQQSFAFGKGAIRWPARELLRRVQAAKQDIGTLSLRPEYHTVRDQLTPEVLAVFNRLRLEPMPSPERQKMKGVRPGAGYSTGRPV